MLPSERWQRGRSFSWQVATTGHFVFGLMLLSAMSGCGSTVIIETPASQSTANDGTEFIHDAGRVIAGEVLTHVFQVANPSDEPMSIRDEHDIERNCGCAAIVPAARSLEPGQHTDVTVTVRTAGKGGLFSHGGSITWISASGKKRAVSLSVHGEAITAIKPNPGLLVFDEEDVKRSTSKELVFTENLPVDWDSLTVSSSSASFQVVEFTKDGKVGRCKVRCSAQTDDLEDLSGSLCVQALALPKSPTQQGLPITVTVPIRARQPVDLVIAPKVVPVAFKQSGDRGVARVLLRGKRVGEGKGVIDSVSCEGYRVEWQMSQRSGNNMAVVQFTFIRMGGEKGTRRGRHLFVKLVGGGFRSLPFVEVETL